MKIAFCLYKYFPYGGLQRDFFRVAQELSQRGHAIRVYTRSWEGDKPKNWEIILVPVRALSNHAKNYKFYRWVQAHLNDHPVDRVVGFNKMPGVDVYYGADVCYAGKLQSKPWWYRLLGRCRHYLSFERQTVARGLPTKLLIISPKQKEEFQKFYGTEDERFFLLPPGIALDRKYSNFEPRLRGEFRNEFKLSSGDWGVLQICSNYALKGVDRSIKAIASLPENVKKRVHLFVVGQDRSEKFIKLSQNLGLVKQIHFLGGRDDIPRFIAGCDLLLHPARLDNTGTVILEALVGGLPEIVSEVCGYSVYVQEANSGMVIHSPYKQDEFNKILHHVFDHSECITEWRKNAQAYADNKDLYSLPAKAADIILQARS